ATMHQRLCAVRTGLAIAAVALSLLAAAALPACAQTQKAAPPAQAQSKTKLVEFEMSPFPYEGINPATGKPFINVDETGRRRRMPGRGTVLREDETFSDQRVLLHIPRVFDIRKPAIMIVFFHGHGAA